MNTTTQKRVFSTEGVDNPLKGISSKHRPYGRLAERVKVACSYGHAHKIVKYGLYRDSLTGQQVMKIARELAEEIKKEAGLTDLEIYQ